MIKILSNESELKSCCNQKAMTPTIEEMREWTAKLMEWTLRETEDEYGNRIGEWFKGDEYTGYDKYLIHSDGEDVSEDLSFLWHPDEDLNQTKVVWERTRELGWYLTLEYLTTGLIQAGFIYKKTLPNRPQRVLDYDPNPAHAIIKAAMAAVPEETT